MKIAKLLVLAALALFSNNAAKAVDGNVWTKPVPEFSSLVVGEVYYFYNTGSDLFFTQGNAWGTQASVGKQGLKVRVEQQSEGVYILTDSVATQKAWKMWWFVDDGIGMYVDYNNQPDYLWEITSMGDNVYRLSPSALNPNVNNNTLFVGLDRTTDPSNTALAANLTADGGYFIDWKLMPEAVGAKFFPELEKYDAAMELKALLDEAEANGLNVASQVAVYNNTGSTLEELNAAITEVKNIIADMSIEKASVENPADVTAKYINNPTFAGDKLDGWSGDAFGSYGPKENAEHYNKTYNTYQYIEGLREGVYAFNAHAFYRAGNAQPAYDNYKAQNEASRYAKIFAASGNDSITTSIASPFSARLTEQLTTGTWSSAVDNETGETFVIPNNMEAANEFFNAGYCNDNKVLIIVSNGNLRVGVRKNTTTGGDWSIFDDFSLTFYGNGDDAYKLFLESTLANIQDIDVEGKVVTQLYVDAYNEARQRAATASTKEDILAAIRAIQAAADDLNKNIKLWQELESLREEAKNIGSDEKFEKEYTEPCSDWAEFDSEDILAAHSLTNEEIEAEIARVKDMINEARQHPINGADMTGLMVNADFQQEQTGWTRVAASGGNVTTGGDGRNICYEAWNNANFDIYQVVEKAPMGVYEISVKGFYRYGRGTAYQSYLAGEYYTTKESCPVFVYMNANTTPFTNIFGDPIQITDETFYSSNSTDYSSEALEDGTVLYFPNGMASAAIAFSNNMYMQSAYGLVSQEGDQIRIGVKGSSNQLGDSWSIWDDFKLTFRGFQPDVVKPVLEQAIIDAENSLNSGIGRDVATDLQAAIDAAKAVLDSNDGKAMFEALTKLFDMQERVNASRELFAQLEAANERLASAIGNAVCSKATQDEANALNQSITAGIENHSFADDEVEGLINDINKMINRLGIPTTMDQASDANPVECTTVIVNPAYVDGNDIGWTGGAAVNATSNDAEKFNTNFDYFQLLQGLPAGTYKVSVQGFYRAGTAKADYDAYVADPTANNNAFLYATGEETVSVPMHRLASQPIVMEGLSDGWIYANEAEYLAVPNSMTTAGDAFQTPGNDGANLFSNNNVIVKVGEDGKLTIGLKKDVQITDDWTIWTNWQLFYYGKNSSLTPSDNPLSIDNMNASNVVSAEVFTVNGVRLSGLQKGVNIVRETLSDGRVVVKKVTVK